MENIIADNYQVMAVLNTQTGELQFSLLVKSFHFKKALMEEHFNENYLESNKYPAASFEGKIIEDIDFTKDGVYSIRTKGNLTIHGVVQERIIKTELTIKNSNISIKSNFTVLLADHNIPIPKVVHENLASEIKVEVKADLVKK